MEIPSFLEDHISQIPALQLLQNMGYTYLTPAETDQLRGNKFSNIILEGVLEQQLRKINKIEFRDQVYEFSNNNITKAIQEIKNISLADGPVITNEKVFDLITLGKSLEENILGDIRSFTLHYIDWKNIHNNVFHVTEEFSVERVGTTETYRPDLVLFVNGIPFVVIECKRPDLVTSDGKKPYQQAISQHLRNQNPGEGIPQLFIYSQLLLAVATNDARYATIESKEEYWAVWKEQFETRQAEELYQLELRQLKNKILSAEQKNKLFGDRFKYVRKHFDQLEEQPIEVTTQDHFLYNLCRPERLMEITYKFLVYDNNEKKAPRYQQYFGVKKTLSRVKIFEDGRRKGGVIWHTQGSGKSLTMVMLAKCLALEESIHNPKIVLVTDRIDLDDQIYRTFKNCGKEVEQAKTGEHLINLLKENKDHIITTVINKFEKVVKRSEAEMTSTEVFVLIDESHRSQYGFSNVRMQKVFPNACFIGFTGTPLMKKDKNTAYKFGGIIDKYTIDQAVSDKAVVPLLYEGRHVVQEVNQKPLDTYFSMVSEPLNEYERADLKKKMSRLELLNEADQKIYRIAWDISLHYKNEWQGTGFKGQLATEKKAVALKFKEYFDQIGLIKTDVLISGADTREGSETIYDLSNDAVQKHWKMVKQKYGNEKEYNRSLINAFKYSDEPEVIIVVDKLLTGFDAPRNTVLYLYKNLSDHNLLQAIARVNRVCEGKDFGYIIDYYGILGNLDKALTQYSGLSDFDEEDLGITLTNINEEIKLLPQRHSQLWDIFKTIANKRDAEAYEQHLRERDIRDKFYERLNSFAKTLKLALSTWTVIENTPEDEIKRYTDDAKFFLSLRVSVKARYSDGIDFNQYEGQIQKLINAHVTSDEIIQLTEQVNIFDKEAFAHEVEKRVSASAKADLIASRTAKTISVEMDKDPAFYKKFSKLLQEVIEEYKLRRISDTEYLKRVTEIMENVRDRKPDDIPEAIKSNDNIRAFYGIALESVKKLVIEKKQAMNLSAEIGRGIDEIMLRERVVDWTQKPDVINRMEQEIEDYLYEVKDKENLEMDFDQMKEIIQGSIDVAKRRYA